MCRTDCSQVEARLSIFRRDVKKAAVDHVIGAFKLNGRDHEARLKELDTGTTWIYAGDFMVCPALLLLYMLTLP